MFPRPLFNNPGHDFYEGSGVPPQGYEVAPSTRVEIEAAERADAIARIAVSAADERIAKLYTALTRAMTPECYPDMYTLAPSGTYRYEASFPGFFRLSKLLLMAPGGTYASRVDVLVERIGHVPFSLTAQKPELGPFKFNIAGGTFVTLTNADAANAATIYTEWEMVHYG